MGKFSLHKPMHDRFHAQADRLKEVKALKTWFAAFSLTAFLLLSTTSAMHCIIVCLPRSGEVLLPMSGQHP